MFLFFSTLMITMIGTQKRASLWMLSSFSFRKNFKIPLDKPRKAWYNKNIERHSRLKERKRDNGYKKVL